MSDASAPDLAAASSAQPLQQDGFGRKDAPSVVDRQLIRDNIEGVVIEVLRPVVTRNSTTTEIQSSFWGSCSAARHMILVTFRPGAVAAWHMHLGRNDYVLIHEGHVLVALYDGRPASPSFGKLQELHLSAAVPTLVKIPPGVWHGIQNLAAQGPAGMINYFDEPYDAADPDSWRLPPDTERIPYRFKTGG